MKTINFYTETLVFLSVAMVLAILATGAGGGPINVSLGIRTSDIMSYLVIQSNPDIFAGSIYGRIAEIVSGSIPFNWLLARYVSEGRGPENAFVILYFLVTLLKLYFYMVIGRALTGRIAGGFVAAFLIIFMVETTLIPYRIISSNIAEAFAMAALAACLYDRFKSAAAIAGLTACIHPTFGMFLMFTIMTSFVTVNTLVNHKSRGELLRSSALMVGVFLALASPFIIISAAEVATRLSPSMSNQETWWNFVPAINNLAFPLMRGIPNFLSYLLVFILTGVLVVGAAPGDRRSVIIASIMGVAVVAYVFQATFTSAINSQLAAQLALNHRANAIALPFIYMAILFAISKSVKEIDGNWFAWLALLLAMLFYDEWNILKGEEPAPRIKAFKTADFIQADAVCALAMSVVIAYSDRINRRSLVAFGMMALVCFFGWVFNKAQFFYYLVPLIIWYGGAVCLPRIRARIEATRTPRREITVATTTEDDSDLHRHRTWSGVVWGLLRRQPTNVVESSDRWRNKNKSFSFAVIQNSAYSFTNSLPYGRLFLVLFCILGVGLAVKVPYEDARTSWGRFVGGEMRTPWIKHFLDRYVPETDHVILMPLRGPGAWLSLAPWRRAYIDPSEGHFLLYQPSHLNEYLRRLAPYAGGSDQIGHWYTDPNIWRKTTGVRTQIASIQEIDDRARWVLTFDKFLCGKDKVHSVHDGYGSGPPGYLGKVVLIRVADLDPTCKSEADNHEYD